MMSGVTALPVTHTSDLTIGGTFALAIVTAEAAQTVKSPAALSPPQKPTRAKTPEAMKKVWTLTYEEPWEGIDTIGVYASKEVADKAKAAYEANRKPFANGWYEVNEIEVIEEFIWQ